MEADELISDYNHECHDGPIEYKWKLVGKSEARIERLATQMNFRLGEGQGMAMYYIGVADDGTALGLSEADMRESIDTLEQMATLLENTSNQLITVGPIAYKRGKEGLIAEVQVRGVPRETCRSDVRVCCLGDVNAGKSTLVGVLSTGTLDNGKGLARTDVFRFAHELELGHTSSITRHQLHFDSAGNVRSRRGFADSQAEQGSTVTFVDLAGHTAYMKTTMFGLTSQCPDYTLVAVAADTIVVEDPTKMYCESLKCADLAQLQCRLCPTDWCLRCFSTHPCLAFRSPVSTTSSTATVRSPFPKINRGSDSSSGVGGGVYSPVPSPRFATPLSSPRNILSSSVAVGTPAAAAFSSPSSSRCPSPLAIPALSRNSSMKKSSSSPSLSALLSTQLGGGLGSHAASIHSSLQDNVTLSRSIGIPTFVVVTRTDVLASELQRQKVLAQVSFELGVASRRVRSLQDAQTLAKPSLDRVPIFGVSAVTGDNLSLLRTFLYRLRKSPQWQELAKDPRPEFDVDETYCIEGVVVVSGVVMRGELAPGMSLYLGPHRIDASFQQVELTSLHNNGVPTEKAVAGQAVTLALRSVKSTDVRKGMAIVPIDMQLAYKGFDAQVSLLGQRYPITPGHETVIYCRTTRQTARIESVEAVAGSLGVKSLVRFVFCFSPEYLRVGSKFVFTDGQLRGVGTILHLIPFDVETDKAHFQRKRRTRAHSESAKDR